ncbi:hypothetical protein D9619_011847 [Psilocybe cf. subviscida]|uniref:Aminoglycoside phosphotransferase domain-containing protein n=1 Tax=Psilocybe cf. subviscida TaxID=2480587 RepID=A0A8H5B059_9AGAR|nr:hypothetical protein D9619_011847 [Psilocybe cf. subviscida]
MGTCYSIFSRGGIPSNGRSSVDSLSDSDVYALIDSAVASGRILGNPATINVLTPPRAWRITQDAVVKICKPSEPFMMSYISTRTSIPMPKVRRVLPLDRSSTSKGERHYLVMDHVEGDILAVAWPTMTWWARCCVIWYMRSYIRQLHNLPLPFHGVAGRVDASGKPCKNHGFYFTRRGAGPFQSYTDMADFYDQRRFNHLVVTHRAYGMLIRGLPKFDRSQPLVVCHLDLHMNNIIVAPNGLPWLIDWGSSGMYPAWLEYGFLAAWGELVPPFMAETLYSTELRAMPMSCLKCLHTNCLARSTSTILYRQLSFHPAWRHLRRLSSTVHDEKFFACTSRRWLCDEERNPAVRYQKFDIDALKRAIASSTGAERVVEFSKIGEGWCNKVFRAGLSDGRSVIARIPTPLAMPGSPHLVTASEVATMRFLRERLGLTQVPRIISWSSRASETPVGAEYIIMDVADGVELETVWHALTIQQKVRVVYQWIQFERRVIKAIRGGGYGSIYYRHDIPPEQARDLYLVDGKDDEFVLGPAVNPTLFWEEEYDKPVDLKLDRGPWPDIASYLKSISNSERAWIQKFARAPSRKYVAPWEPPVHLKDPADHIRLLDLYDMVASYFIPADADFLRPTLRLLDSNSGNIFLSKDALDRDGSIEISAVIDWQHTAVLPLYLCVTLPVFVDSATPAPRQDQELSLKEQDHLRMAYRMLYSKTGWDDTWASALALTLDHGSTSMQLPLTAQGCWHGGYVKVKKTLIDVARNWKVLFPHLENPPLGKEPFSDEEILRADQDEASWQAAYGARASMQEKIGVDDYGGVDLDGYDSAVRANQKLFEEWLETVSSDDLDGTTPTDIWPYRLR